MSGELSVVSGFPTFQTSKNFANPLPIASLPRPTAHDWQVLPALTKREKEVLNLVADGQTSATIAVQLHVSPLTVETHRRNLMQKFNVKTMAAAVKLAMEMGLLS